AQADDGRTIHLRRLQISPQKTAPVLDAADPYIRANEPFGYSGMLLLGLLLLYRKEMPPSDAWVLAVLKRVALRLREILDATLQPGKQPMFCSQFVYACFEDAAKTYPELRLRIENGLLSSVKANASPLLAQAARLAPQVDDVGGMGILQEHSAHANRSDQELAGHLLDSLVSRGGDADTEEFSAELAYVAVHLDRLLARAFGKQDMSSSRLFLLKEKPLLVTPVDLYANCPSLQRVNVDFKVTRDPTNIPFEPHTTLAVTGNSVPKPSALGA
ncbi:MAG: hypothetical protein ACM3ZE_11290, partial [Myxococcales bacterium]